MSPDDDLPALELESLRPDGDVGPVPAWVRLLFRPAVDFLAPDEARDLALARAQVDPARAVGWLSAIVDDDALARIDAIGGGSAPLRAAWILGRLAAPAAIPSLLAALERAEREDLLFDAALVALAAIGPAVVEPALATIEALGLTADAPAEEDADLFVALTEVAASARVRDPRVRAVILEVLDADPVLGAGYCATSGDPALIPALRARWDAYAVDEDDAGPFGNDEGLELGTALVDLGAAWSDADRAKLDRIVALRSLPDPGGDAPDQDPELTADVRELLAEADREATAVVGIDDDLDDDRPLDRPAAPGRNDPCWCGSGRKYKRCHLDADARDDTTR